MLRLALLPALMAIALLGAWRLGYFELDHREQLVTAIRHVQNTRWVAPLYVLSCTAVVILGLPVLVLAIFGGALFGTIYGLLLVWTGLMIGTIATYFLARSIGKAPVQRLFGSHTLLRKLGERADFWMLLRLRVLPMAPFGVFDYVAGLAGVPLWRLLLATAAGVIPGTLAHTYVGEQLMIGLGEAGQAGQRALWIATAVSVMMASLSLAPLALRKFRKWSGSR